MSDPAIDRGDESLEGRITDAELARMRAAIGREAPVPAWNSAATEDAIWHFALGVGDDNPLWWNRAYARRTAWGEMFAPPTFLYSCASGPRFDPEPAGVEGFLPGVLGLWASDRWVWHRPTWADEPVQAVGSLYDVAERSSRFAGRSVAQTDLTRFTGADGEPIAELYRTVLRFERSGGRAHGRYAEMEPATYSPDELARIKAHYEREPDQRRGGTPRYWDDVAVGDSLLTLVKGPLTLTNIVGWMLGWGSPMCPTNRIASRYLEEHPGARLYNPETGVEDTIEAGHWEDYFVRHSGLPAGYDFGPQRISWVAHLLTDWYGDDGFLEVLEVRLRAMNHIGDTTWLSGRVTDKREGAHGPLVDCAVEGVNQRGEVTTTATATVRLPRRS